MFKYFEHEADVGIIGIGDSFAEAFQEAAKAMFNTEVDIRNVQPKQRVKIECEAENIEELFVEWLNRLLTEAGINDLVFCKFDIIEMSRTYLKGYAYGEPLDPSKHHIKTEVKAATYSELFVGRQDNKFIAQCIIDV